MSKECDGETEASELQRLRDELERLQGENETLRNRCQKLAKTAQTPRSSLESVKVQPDKVQESDYANSSTAKPTFVDCATQTDEDENGDAGKVVNSKQESGHIVGGNSEVQKIVGTMFENLQDEASQQRGIEALFALQTQATGIPNDSSSLLYALQASTSIFSSHPSNPLLLLKASQFLSVLLAEQEVGRRLPIAVLSETAHVVAAVAAEHAESSTLADDLEKSTKPGQMDVSKLLTWFLSLLALLIPFLSDGLKNKEISEKLVQQLVSHIVGSLLEVLTDLPQHALLLKCVQLLPLLPPETAWIQSLCLETGVVHSLVLCHHRCTQAGTKSNVTVQAIGAAVSFVFKQNLQLCLKAISDSFVTDAFVCLEVLRELKEIVKANPSIVQEIDEADGFTSIMELWNFHQRQVLEDQGPSESNSSQKVLKELAYFCRMVLARLPHQQLLKRMQELQAFEPLQRLSILAITGNAQLRMQIAVNYVSNGAASVLLAALQVLLRRFESGDGQQGEGLQASVDVESAFALLKDDQLPAEVWPYVNHCLDLCIHILSHWATTKISMEHKADVLDPTAAPLLLAQQGLVDILLQIIDSKTEITPQENVFKKATDTLRALFENNGHICLFCMQHYADVKQVIRLGCDSLIGDPLAEYPDMQQQAVDQLVLSLKHFFKDEKLCRKILRALSALFETSPLLTLTFLTTHTIGTGLGGDAKQLPSTEAHIEAVRAVGHVSFWGPDDSSLLPDFVTVLVRLLLDAIPMSESAVIDVKPGRMVMDLSEAEGLVSFGVASLLRILLVDPNPPTVQECLVEQLGHEDRLSGETTSERAVKAVMRILETFPSSDRVQISGQHLLTSVLGE